MIQIRRCDCPDFLKTSKAKNRYGDKRVVAKLWDMQHGKCCYCEQMLPEYGQQKAVEHFEPKSVFKKKRNDWKNLLLVCPECNGTKSDKFPVLLTNDRNETNVVFLKRPRKEPEPLLLDPSDPSADPEKHITFIVDKREGPDRLGQVMERNHSRRGRATIDTTGLYDSFYVRHRKDFIEMLESAWYNLMHAMARRDQESLDVWKERFRGYMLASHGFAGVARAYARHMKMPQYFKIKIPRGAEN